MPKTDSRILSAVGRVSSPPGAYSFRPFASPAIMRIASPTLFVVIISYLCNICQVFFRNKIEISAQRLQKSAVSGLLSAMSSAEAIKALCARRQTEQKTDVLSMFDAATGRREEPAVPVEPDEMNDLLEKFKATAGIINARGLF